MPNKNRVRLEICGTEYIITSDEPESYMLELGAQLDRDMRTLMNGDPRVSPPWPRCWQQTTRISPAKQPTRQITYGRR